MVVRASPPRAQVKLNGHSIRASTPTTNPELRTRSWKCRRTELNLSQRGAHGAEQAAPRDSRAAARYIQDLQNILNSTDVATLFLDANLNIRFFTPAAKIAVHTGIASDVGRPLADLTRAGSRTMISCRMLARCWQVTCPSGVKYKIQRRRAGSFADVPYRSGEVASKGS